MMGKVLEHSLKSLRSAIPQRLLCVLAIIKPGPAETFIISFSRKYSRVAAAAAVAVGLSMRSSDCGIVFRLRLISNVAPTSFWKPHTELN